MKVLGLTSIRSEYDLMTPLFSLLNNDLQVQLKLLVGGAHNSPSFGLTRNDVYNDGYDILLEIESLIDSDTKSARLKSASVLLMSAIDTVKSYSPDLIIYAGDREEVMIGALLGAYLGIPTLHLYGGDHAADGHVDNPVRHAVSKLSTCHFVSTDEHRQRLLNIGEPEFRVFNVGSIALDKFHSVNVNKNIIQELAQKPVTKKTAIVIYHPIEEDGDPAQVIETLLESLQSEGFHSFIGLPNSDPGNSLIRQAIKEFSVNNSDVTVYGNLKRDDFVSLFKSSDMIIGNSSAGLLEAASIPIPCVNVGARQKGRSCGTNVIFTDISKHSVIQAIKKSSSSAFKDSFAATSNPYGDGQSAKTAYKLIKTLDFRSMLAKKEDPLDV